MKTRVRPQEFDRYRSGKRWAVEVFDQQEFDGKGQWVASSYHRFMWVANFKANRLASYSLETKQNRKEKFVDRLKNGEEDEA